MNKIKIPVIVSLSCAALFSLLSIHFSFDVSIFAFPLAALITGSAIWFVYFNMVKKCHYKYYKLSLCLMQYLPYILLLSFIIRRAGKNGTYFFYDVITVLLWCVSSVARWIVLFYLKDKRVFALVPEWEKFKTEKGSQGAAFSFNGATKELLSWVDALCQAVFMVLLVQIFLFQLYIIPSESMVPSFLIGDRVVVEKVLSGPKFPLSDVGLPCVKSYNRGDVVVFRNPHYKMDRKSEVRTVLSQLVYMLTFTTVNLNVDENGEPKADPLVKRICGVPGEQLVMQDGILYRRTAGNDTFEPVEFDNKYARWSLNEVNQKIKNGIQYIPLTKEQYDIMLEVEELRRGLNISDVAIECWSISQAMQSLVKRNAADNQAGAAGFSLIESELFNNFYENTKEILETKAGYEWFKGFMTDWNKTKYPQDTLSYFEGDYYSEANFRLNLMIKLTVGRLYLRAAQLMATNGNMDLNKIRIDSKICDLFGTAQKLHMYLMLLDQRNMPVFPANSGSKPSYIPENCYFMMGDNRFNSLDMRHSYEFKETALSAEDGYSVLYYSNMQPQYVNRKLILGSALYRFWPLNRRGTIHTR